MHTTTNTDFTHRARRNMGEREGEMARADRFEFGKLAQVSRRSR